MIEVDLGNGQVLEFPDGTDQKEIQGYIDQNHPMKGVPINTILPGTRPGPTLVNAAKREAAALPAWRKATYGAERALDEAALGLKQITAGLSPEDEASLAHRRAVEQAIPGSWASRMVGDAALWSAPALKAQKAVQALRAGTAAKYAGAAGIGATIGGLQPVIGDDSRLTNILSGGAFGLAGQAGGDLVSTMISGAAQRNPSTAKLPAAAADKMTLGQSVDRNTHLGRLLATTEERLQSVPVAGNIITNHRQAATDTWRDSLLNRVAPKGHIPVGANTREKLDDIYRAYSDRYSTALRNHQIPPSQLFESQVLNITNNPRSGLTAAQQAEVRDMAMNYYRSMFHGNNPATGPAGVGVVTQGGHRGAPISIDATNAKGFEAFLTGKAAQYRRSNTPGAPDMAKMFENLERAWSVAYRRSLPSSARVATKELDRGYAPYKTVERAAEAVGNDFGNFTPQQLLAAVKSRTPGSRFARGKGILQDEAQAARDTLIDRTPNSGTADRAMTFGALAGMVTDPATTGTTLGITVPTMVTRTGRNAVLGETKLQRLLQLMRANRAAEMAGLPSGITFQDMITEETPEY